MNKAFEIYNMYLPIEVNEVILTKLKNQIKYDIELIDYEKLLKEQNIINQINEERRRFAQIRVGLDPDDEDIPQIPYRHLREQIIPNKPVLEK